MTGSNDYTKGHTPNCSAATQGPDGPAGETKSASISELLATTATGWCVVFDGIMDIRTMSDTGKTAALCGLAVCGYGIVDPCENEKCDCTIQILYKMVPNAKIVPVKVEVA